MTVSIQEAQSQLEELAAKAAAGEEVVVTRDGMPIFRVSPIESQAPKRKLGQLQGLWTVPDNFDTMYQKEIEEMFYGDPDKPTQ